MSSFKPWKVVQLDLSESIPSLPFDPGIQGVYMVFWWYGIPLGQQEIPASQLPMSTRHLAEIAVRAITPAVGDHLLEKGFKAPLPEISRIGSEYDPPDFEALMTLDRPLEKLRERLSTFCGQSTNTAISVVICTRDRPEHLERCLRSLQNLTRHPHEILVIDNAPGSDATKKLVTQFPNVRYVLEPRAGLDIARNTGIRQSTGDIVAFIDDDVTVHPNWVMALQHGFKDPGVMAITGLVLPAELETEAQCLFETYWGFNRGYRIKDFDSSFFKRTRFKGVPAWVIGAGANMAFRRRVFEIVGDFDERLDVGAAGCNGDSEFWYRLLAVGCLCRYLPMAVAYHYHRKDMEGLNRQLFYYMRGFVAALLIQFEEHGHWGNLLRLFLALPRHYVKLFAEGLVRGFKGRYRTLAAEVAGCISGGRFYMHNQRPRTPRR